MFYAALDPDLKRLDEAQHVFAETRKQARRQSPQLITNNAENAFDVEIRVRATGRTKQLATLEAWEWSPGSARRADVMKHWMLHIPSGRLLTFEDLFVDPGAVHEQIVSRYLSTVPQYLDSIMSSLAFMGDDPEQEAKDFRGRYLLETHRIATMPIQHFPGVRIAADGQRVPYVFGGFSSELLPDRAPASWTAALDDLSPHFKPEFRNVLDGIHCPQMPAGDAEGR